MQHGFQIYGFSRRKLKQDHERRERLMAVPPAARLQDNASQPLVSATPAVVGSQSPATSGPAVVTSISPATPATPTACGVSATTAPRLGH